MADKKGAKPADKKDDKGGKASLTILAGSHFKLGKRIGKGNFGEVRLGKNTKNNDDVAIKTEATNAKPQQLPHEYNLYKMLGATDKKQNISCVPKIFYFGPAGKQHNALVMELMGPCIEDLFNLCDRKFSLKTVYMIVLHTLHCMEFLHDKGIVYRDVKPENFVVGRHSLKKDNQIVLLDFGLAKEYIDPDTKKHIPFSDKQSLTGTARYMSINTHLGKEQSRRDDLEALGHMYIYLTKGTLPWQGLKVASKDRFQKIGEMKRATAIPSLCEGYPELAEYLTYVRKLNFNENPNYTMLKDLFKSAMQKKGLEDDLNYDWIEKKKLHTNEQL